MDNSFQVSLIQGFRYLAAYIDYSPGLNRALSDLCRQCSAFYVLHGYEWPMIRGLSDVVDGADILMSDCRCGPSLLDKPAQAVWIGGKVGGQDLQGNRAAQTSVFGKVDLAHPAGSDCSDYFVWAYRLA
jgi:hypothetical protein